MIFAMRLVRLRLVRWEVGLALLVVLYFLRCWL